MRFRIFASNSFSLKISLRSEISHTYSICTTLTNTPNTNRTLFIAGCARSGTTALTRLLNSHPDIFIGTELFRTEFLSGTDSFDKNLLNSKKFRSKLGEKNQLPVSFQYIGDKFPSYYSNYDLLFQQFDQVKVVFIFRNIFDVAQSYKARKLHPTNPWKKGVRRAIAEWNTSLDNTLTHINAGLDITPVCYETILYKPDKSLERLLDLRPSNEFKTFYKKVANDASKIESKRINILNNKEKLYIMRNARFDLYNRIFEKAKNLNV